ncbi:O-antigen ligase family protein [Rhizobium sp. L43]|uniref:O-antigen ligase family protein n=1 Tax=Rhizobium sp. L43 TaxID=2035452 RepID=UPI00117B39A0|nr:O-antigen ligase family protein [Rhizobium sp. L43]
MTSVGNTISSHIGKKFTKKSYMRCQSGNGGSSENIAKVYSLRKANIIIMLFSLTLFLFPFNGGLIVLPPLGEARAEPYFIISLILFPLTAFYVLSGRFKHEVYFFGFIFVGLMFIVLTSGIASVNEIVDSAYKGETGPARFASGLAVPLFGCYYAVTLACVAKFNLKGFILKPLILGAYVVAAFGVIEAFSWLNGGFRDLFVTATSPLFSAMRRGETVMWRIQSVTYEASNFGFYVSLLIPLILHARRTTARPKQVMLNFTLAALLLESFFSGRTSFLAGMLGLLSFYTWLHIVRGGPYVRLGGIIFAWLVPFMVAFVPIAYNLLFEDAIIADLWNTDSISNVSRYSGIFVQIKLMLSNPILGVGLNQYGFYAAKLLPDWAYVWETQAWLYDPAASFFPSFSLYTRIGAETGITGLLLWCTMLGFLQSQVTKRGIRVSMGGGEPTLAAAILAGMMGLLFILWTVASFKIFNIWFLIGISVSYIVNWGRFENPGGRQVPSHEERKDGSAHSNSYAKLGLLPIGKARQRFK